MRSPVPKVEVDVQHLQCLECGYQLFDCVARLLDCQGGLVVELRVKEGLRGFMREALREVVNDFLSASSAWMLRERFRVPHPAASDFCRGQLDTLIEGYLELPEGRRCQIFKRLFYFLLNGIDEVLLGGSRAGVQL